jgi:osmotically-inducible protein OsmY
MNASLKHQIAEDRDLEHRIINFLQERHVPECQGVQVKAAVGTVVVSGQVSSAHSKWLCMECCRHVAGVIKLVDKVRIGSSPSQFAGTTNTSSC